MLCIIIIYFQIASTLCSSKCPNFGKLNYTCTSFDYCDSTIGLVCGDGTCGIECPNDWQLYNSSCFLPILTKTLNFFDAVKYCLNYQANLMTTKTVDELREIRKSVLDNSQETIWLSCKTSDYLEFEWPDGSKLLANNSLWKAGEPNNYGGGEECVTAINTLLNDATCTDQFKFVCELKISECNDTKCSCKAGTYYSIDKCVPYKSVNEMCTSDFECNPDSFLKCENSKCICPDGKKWYTNYEKCLKCPMNWIYKDGMCYMLHYYPFSIYDALSTCSKFNAQLIKFKENITILYDLFSPFKSYFNPSQIWVDASSLNSNILNNHDAYQWCTGVGSYSMCNMAALINDKICLNYNSCWSKLGFICEAIQ